MDLDVSLEMTRTCVSDADGGVIIETKAGSDLIDISKVLHAIDGTYERVGFEAGSLSQHL